MQKTSRGGLAPQLAGEPAPVPGQSGASPAAGGRELGLSRSAYTYYETGKTTPSAVDLFTLAQLYRVPVEEFFRP